MRKDTRRLIMRWDTRRKDQKQEEPRIRRGIGVYLRSDSHLCTYPMWCRYSRPFNTPYSKYAISDSLIPSGKYALSRESAEPDWKQEGRWIKELWYTKALRQEWYSTRTVTHKRRQNPELTARAEHQSGRQKIWVSKQPGQQNLVLQIKREHTMWVRENNTRYAVVNVHTINCNSSSSVHSSRFVFFTTSSRPDGVWRTMLTWLRLLKPRPVHTYTHKCHLQRKLYRNTVNRDVWDSF